MTLDDWKSDSDWNFIIQIRLIWKRCVVSCFEFWSNWSSQIIKYVIIFFRFFRTDLMKILMRQHWRCLCSSFCCFVIVFRGRPSPPVLAHPISSIVNHLHSLHSILHLQSPFFAPYLHFIRFHSIYLVIILKSQFWILISFFESSDVLNFCLIMFS